jgi:hypothetical protein
MCGGLGVSHITKPENYSKCNMKTSPTSHPKEIVVIKMAVAIHQ